jgi:hypothetical protein
MTEYLSEAALVKLLLLTIEESGLSRNNWAHANGVSPQYLCDVLLGRRPPRDAIAKALGYRGVRAFEPIEDPHPQITS